MSRNKNKKELPLAAVTVKEETVSCSNCPFYKSIDTKFGKCVKRIAPYIDPKNLTVHGPLGNFYIMTPDMVCGEHPKYLSLS